MPTPNWGPQAGVPMDQATFDAYVSANPPGTGVNNIYGNPQVGANAQRDPFSVGGNTSGTAPGGNLKGATEGLKWWEDYFNRGPSSVDMPGFQTGNQDQARLEQQRVIQALQAQAAGDPNSQAQQQLSQAYGNARSQQSSLGSTMRGQSAGAAMRGIQQGQQALGAQEVGDHQMLMLQEQQAAQAMLAQLLQQQHQQDITQAQGMAQGQLQGDALNQAMQQFYGQSGLGAALAREQQNRERNAARLGINMGWADLGRGMTNSMMQAGGSILGGLSQMGSSSDPTHNSYSGGTSAHSNTESDHG